MSSSSVVAPIFGETDYRETDADTAVISRLAASRRKAKRPEPPPLPEGVEEGPWIDRPPPVGCPAASPIDIVTDNVRRKDRPLMRGTMASCAVHLLVLAVLGAMMIPLSGLQGRLKLELVLDSEEELKELLELKDLDATDDGGQTLAMASRGSEEPVEVEVEIPSPLAGDNRGQGAAGTHGTSAGRQGDGHGGKQRGTSFFGTHAYGDRFVYILDVSGSMGNNGAMVSKTNNRYQRASSELMRSVNQLQEDQSFYVMLFSSTSRSMFDDPESKALIPATYDNKQRLRAWLAGIQPGGGTDPRQSLKQGLGILPDAIFLLSDGEFNKLTPTAGWFEKQRATASDIVDQHNLISTPIHTVAYEDPKNRQTLEVISNKTGGEHRYVPPSPQTLVENIAEFERAGRWTQAMAACRQIIKGFPGTPEAAQATTALPRLRQSLQLAKLPGRKRNRLISRMALAEQFATEGKVERALNLYRGIVKEFPDTDHAEKARQQIEALTKVQEDVSKELELLIGKP